MTENDIKEKLVKLLITIFQFDTTDLDFGVYKILNYKKKEILDFINKDLVDEIGKQLNLLGAEEQKKQQQDLEKMKKQLIDLGIEDYENNAKYQEKKKQLDGIKVLQELEKETYNHIYAFFSRYYDRGDFLSKRRYGSIEKYSIPYNGEEVLLHWTNNDHYYIKSTETFRNFSFKITGLKVNFRVVDAEEENGNIKSDENKFFLTSSDKIYDFKENELDIYFTFRSLNENELARYPRPNQEQINDDIVEQIKNSVKNGKIIGLLKEENGKAPLHQYLNKYTKRNTSDYFIHKDLKGFLERELDFYIKNEVVDLGDVSELGTENFIIYVLKIKILRNICIRIIEFLAQIENFQKKLWEKKKFVLATNYCITLDYLASEFYPKILKNKQQLDEWKEIYRFDIQEESKKLNGTLKYHQGVDIQTEILKQNPTLMIDTKFFDDEFKIRLLESIAISDEKINGILINSENFQALNLIAKKYRNKIACCYVDPPYNTNATPILYKNNYKHSSWLTLMKDRLHITKQLLIPNKGIFSIAIDDTELANLSKLIETSFFDYELQKVVVNHYPGSGTGRSNISKTHEYNLFLIPNGVDILRGKLEGEDGEITRERNFRRSGTGENNYRVGRPNSFFAILVDPKTYIIHDIEKPPESDTYLTEKKGGLVRIYPIGEDGSERVWSLSYEGAKAALQKGLLKCTKNLTVLRIYEDDEYRNLLSSLWTDKRFNATTYGTNLLTSLFGQSGLFSYPKSVFTTLTAIDAVTYKNPSSIILDFFAGSGTTGHAVLKLNKQDNGNRKFILVEMGQYFNTVLKPRIQKIIFTENWKNGTPQDNKGMTKQIIKYHSLEQYEDALENIEFSQKKLSEFSDYFVKYVLDFETRDSKTFLNIGNVMDPFNYKINITENYLQKEVAVDLLETYNYLIGLELEYLKTFENKDDKNRRYVTMQGTRDDKSVLVIWRNIDGLDMGKDRDFIQKNILKDQYDEIHLNGDSLIKNAILIEEQFKTLMNGS